MASSDFPRYRQINHKDVENEATNHFMKMKTEDLENKLKKSFSEKMTMELINQDLKIRRDHLHHYLCQEVRSFQREKENLEKDLILQMESKKLKMEIELEIVKRKADEDRQKLEKKIENLTVETAKLAENISNKDAEISDLKIKYNEEMDEHELDLIEELEAIIRKIQAEHDQNKMERNQMIKKLEEEKKSITRNIEDIQIENEENHELQQTFETTLEKVNEKWRRIYDTLEQQRLNKWMILNDTIYQLKSEMEDGIDATEAK